MAWSKEAGGWVWTGGIVYDCVCRLVLVNVFEEGR
jgi:hypothetical protein